MCQERFFFFFNDTATTEIYTLSLHDALPIFLRWRQPGYDPAVHLGGVLYLFLRGMAGPDTPVVDQMRCGVFARSEEHTSELQSRQYLVCRLLLEKKTKTST